MQDMQVDGSQSSETTTSLHVFVSIFYLHSAQLFLVYDAKNNLSGHSPTTGCNVSVSFFLFSSLSS